MWFRRKKKSDADSALTDALQSLQSLLDDHEPDPPDTDPVAHAKTIPDSSGSTAGVKDPIDPEQRNIKNAVASEEHLEWDFKVDMAADEVKERATDRAFLKAVESGGLPDLGLPDGAAVVPIRRGQEFRADTRRVAPEAGRDLADDIPVLRKIVHLAGRGETARGGPGDGSEETPFVDQCLKDMRKRLKRNELTPLTPNQEKHFRAALTSLLLQKTSGKFE